jgi:hypothetical protein
MYEKYCSPAKSYTPSLSAKSTRPTVRTSSTVPRSRRGPDVSNPVSTGERRTVARITAGSSVILR